jgi:hypothetical protein
MGRELSTLEEQSLNPKRALETMRNLQRSNRDFASQLRDCWRYIEHLRGVVRELQAANAELKANSEDQRRDNDSCG